MPIINRSFFDIERFIHSLKTAFACLLGFAVSELLSGHVEQWLIITILVVMCAQLNVGSVIQKSYMRFLGTLAGSLIAILAIEFLNNDLLVVASVVAASGLLFSYIATSHNNYSDAGTLGAVTTTIILIGQNPTLAVAAERFFEISVGIVIAALVSQFVLPIHARMHLRRNQARTFRQLRAYYLASLLTNQSEEQSQSYHELDENIVKILIKQRKLAIDAVREPLKQEFSLENFNQLLLCEKEILRSIAYMQYAYKESSNTKELFSTMSILHHFHDKICEALEQIAHYLEYKATKKLIIVLPTTESLETAIQNKMGYLTEPDMVYAHAFLFCARILLDRLEQIISLVNKMNAHFVQSPEIEED